MEIILAILLHLHLIHPGGVYTKQEIRQMKWQNKQEIQLITTQPSLLQEIMREEMQDVNTIVVIDDSLIE